MHLKRNTNGFSIVEILLVLAVFAILLGGSALALSRFTTGHQLESVSTQLLSAFRRAQGNAMARYQDSPWGVYLDVPQRRFVLFKGQSYAARDASFDQATAFSQALQLGNINLQGGGSEVIFTRATGETANTGSFTLTDTAAADAVTFNFNLYGQINVQ